MIRKYILSILTCAVFFSGSGAVFSARQPSTVFHSPQSAAVSLVPFNPGSITVDGELNDQEWFASAAFTGFIDNTSRSFPSRQTVVYICYDDTRLNLGFQSGKPGSEDQIVVALRPKDLLYVFSISPSGQVTARAGVDEIQAVSMSKVTSEGKWVCEMSIPFSALGTTKPGDRDSWLANFVRVYSNPFADTSWASRDTKDLYAFTDIELGRLQFRNNGPYLKVTSLGAIDQARLRIDGSYFEKPDPNERLPEGKKKDFYVDMPMEDQGRTLPFGYSVFFDPGVTKPFSVVSDSAGGVEREEIATTTRPARSISMGFGYGYYNGWASYSTDRFMKSERFPVRKPFEKACVYSYVLQPEDRMVFFVETLGLTPDEIGKLNLTAQTISPSGEVLENLEVGPAKRGEYEMEFDAARLGYGKNVFRVVLTDGTGIEVGRTERPVEKPDPSQWVGNRIGISDAVPPPFEPVRRKKDSVLVWGRKYTFKGSSVVADIISKEKSLLSAPAVLRAEFGGKAIALKPSGWKFDSVKDSAAILTNTLSSDIVDVKLKNTIEFDGMMRVDLTLSPKSKNASIDHLAFVVPMKAEHASYLTWTRALGASDNRNWHYGAFPAEGFKGDFRPYVWLGDNERGLLWFAEYAKYWSVKDKVSVLSARKQDDVVYLTVTMIDKPTVIKEPTTITFGLQAGPVKPLPNRWRDFPKNLSYVFSSDYGIQDHNPLVVVNDAKRIEEKVRKGERFVMCAYPANLATGTPAWTFHASEWRNTGPVSRSKGGYDLDQMCMATGWTDFQLWAEKTALDLNRNRHVGLWYDLSWIHHCYNLDHPDCAYKDEDGNVVMKYNIFALRDHYKRIYTLFRSRMKDTYIVAHSSASNMLLPSNAFVDAIWDGEQYAYFVSDYIKDVPADKWRAEFMGKQFGPVPIFYSILRYVTEDKATYNLATMLYLHDLLYNWGYYNGKILEAFGKVKDDFGVAEADTRFIPYWEAMGETFRSVNTDILVSAYTRPGKALLVVGNLSDKAVDEAVTIDFAKLGVNPGSVQVFDGRTTVDVPVDARSIRLKIDAKSPVLVIAK